MDAIKNWSNRKILKYIESEDKAIRGVSLGEVISLSEINAGADHLKMLAMSITAKYDKVTAVVKEALQGQTVKAQDLHERTISEDEKRVSSQKISDAKEEKRVAEAERRSKHITYDWSKYPVLLTLELLTFGGEWVFNISAFTLLGGPLLFSILPALIISIALCAVAVWVPGYVRAIEHPSERKTTLAKISLAMALVFTSIGILRSVTALGHGSWHLSWPVVLGTIIFVVLSLIIFAGAVIISNKLPTSDDRMVKKTIDALTKRIQMAEKVIAAEEKNIKAAGHSANTKRKQRIQDVGQEAHYEQMIKAMCHQTLTEVYRTFLVRRPDTDQSLFLLKSE